MAENQSTVLFREIKDHPGYWVTNTGEVWSFRFDKKIRMRPSQHRDGHWQAVIRQDKKRKVFYVHILVLEAFVGPRPEGMEGCHEDDDPSNNHVSNLKWGTRQDNAKDASRNGKLAFGERNGYAKLTDEVVRDIRRMYASGYYSQQKIADKVGIHQTAVSRVIRGQTWARTS